MDRHQILSVNRFDVKTHLASKNNHHRSPEKTMQWPKHYHLSQMIFIHFCWIFVCVMSSSLVPVASFLPWRSTFRKYNNKIKFDGIALPLRSSSSSSLLEEIIAMRVSDIKKELQERNISTLDVYEKEELVKRLLLARKNNVTSSDPPQASEVTNGESNSNKNLIVTTPLYFTSMDRNLRIASVTGDGGITVDANQQPYATLKLQVIQPSSNNNSKDATTFSLSLLIDTACSGFVLRPQVQKRYNLPSFQTPVTMTGAAGVSQATGLTQIDRFTVGNRSFGPLPAAVQDIGGLPSSLDGILGLSFLSQFAAFELDFRSGSISLYPDKSSLPSRSDETILANAKMTMLGSLGIFTVPVYLGGRGPVQMLVDTGAACTLLNWRGVSDLGLSVDSPKLSRIPIPTGAMGSDNIAIQLSHRLFVSSAMCVGGTSLAGISFAGAQRLSIDVGNIPVIDRLPGVGGILGADSLMRCGVVRISCKEPPTIALYQ